MSRYTGPSWKRSRRLGISLSGTGKEIARRNYAPGQHGPNSRGRLSEYGQQLHEKQKLRWMFGLNERQFQNLFILAMRPWRAWCRGAGSTAACLRGCGSPTRAGCR